MLSVLLCAEGAQADAYDQGLARARSLEGVGNLVGAALELEKLLPAYSQDYALAAHAGWYYALAGRYRDGERMYREATSRAPLAIDAHAGLAWTLAQQHKCREADSEWSTVLRLDPVNVDARAGLHACQKAPDAQAAKLAADPWMRAAFTITAHEYAYVDHPFKRSGTGGAVGANLWNQEGVSAGLLFRYTRFETLARFSGFSQNELYASVGWERAAYGVAMQGAVLREDTDEIGPSAHLGVSGYVRLVGELSAALSYSQYELLDFARFESSWRLKMTDRLRVVPGAALGASATGTTANGMLGILVEVPRLSLWAGGKYGPEVRPAYLPQMLVYAMPERIRWGVWSGVRARLSRWFNVGLSYSADQIEVASENGAQARTLHAGALTASVVL